MAMDARDDDLDRIRLAEWARREGIARITAYRMLRRGILPVPVERSPTGRWYVLVPRKRFGLNILYARASQSRYQVEALNRQVAELSQWATDQRRKVFSVVKEVANPLTSALPNLERVLADTRITEIVIHNPDVVGIGRYPLLVAALAPQQRTIITLHPEQREDDLEDVLSQMLDYFP